MDDSSHCVLRRMIVDLMKKMEKIILVVFGANLAPNALNFACYLSGMGRSRLTGYFFEDDKYEDTPVMKKAWGFPYVETIVAGDTQDGISRKAKTENNMKVFMETCGKKGMLTTALRCKPSGIDEIVAESNFADLLIIDAASFDDSDEQEFPSDVVRKILASALCPVVIAPASHSPIEEIVFCYDGSPSSVYAMKQFVYLFPDQDSARATVVQANEAEKIPENEKKRVMQWLSRHYNYADFIALKGDGENELLNYLLKKKHAMVIMGAYGRNMISRFFRQSHADLLIKTLAYPVFIAHH